MKKAVLSLIFISLIAFIILGYMRLKQPTETNTGFDLPIPAESTEVLIALNDIDFFASKAAPNNIFVQALERIFEWGDFFNTFKLASEAWATQAPRFFLILQGNGHDTDWLLLGQLRKTSSTLLPPRFENQWHIHDTLNYTSNQILHLKSNEQELFLQLNTNRIVMGSSRLVVENYLRFTNTKRNPTTPQLRQLLSTLDTTATANVIVNYQQLNYAFSGILQKGLFPSHLNAWGAYDFSLSKNALYVAGLTSTERQGIFAADKLNGKSEGLLPDNTISFEQYCLPSTQVTDQHYCNNSALLLYAKKNLSGRVLNAKLYDPTQKSGLQHLQMLETHNGDQARTALLQYINKPLQADTLRIAQDQLLLFSLPENLGQCLGLQSPKPYMWAVWHNQILLGSRQAIELCFRSIATGKTLNHDTHFTAYASKLPQQSNYWFYLNPRMLKFWMPKYVNPAVATRVDEASQFWNEFGGFSLQLEQKQGIYYTHIFAEQSQRTVPKANLANWATPLDTTFTSKPTFVWNHQTNSNDIVLQDLNNTLYWINAKGEILWKRTLGERIKSPIHIIDFYSNNKFQLLFNTTNKLYLIDRLGRDTDRYPIALPYPATNGLSVFDYDNQKDYRILIACLDKKIYAFDKSGQPIQGWNRLKTDTEVEGPIQHLRIQNKDYIVLADHTRNYILDRKGHERINIRQQFSRLAQNEMYFDLNPAEQRPFFITTNTQGNIHKIYLNGAVQTTHIGQWSNNHHFLYEDFDGDGLSDYIFLDNKTLRIVNRIQETLFEYHFDQQIFDPPSFYTFSSTDKRIGVFSRNAHQAYLFSKSGQATKGFPLNAQSPFSIGRFDPNTSQFSILVGRNERFLFNYNLN